MISARPNPVKDPAEIKSFFKGFRGGIVERGPKVVESEQANQGTTLKSVQWKHILLHEDKDHISHSTLYNSLRRGLETQVMDDGMSEQKNDIIGIERGLLDVVLGNRQELPSCANLRPRIWAFLIRAEKLKQQYPLEKYTELASWKFQNAEMEKLRKQIEADLDRTHFDQFKNKLNMPLAKDTKEYLDLKSSIRNVLTAIANLIPSVGYVQGMNHILAAISYNLQEALYVDQEAFPSLIVNKELFMFWIMIYIMQDLNWRCIFTQKFAKLRKVAEAFEQRLLDSSPQLLEHIYNYGINDGYNTKNLDFSLLDIFFSNVLTILTDSVPVSKTGPVLDIFLLSGEKVITDVLLRALFFNKERILAIKEKEKLRNFLKREMISSFFENREPKEIFPFSLNQKILE